MTKTYFLKNAAYQLLPKHASIQTKFTQLHYTSDTIYRIKTRPVLMMFLACE